MIGRFTPYVVRTCRSCGAQARKVHTALERQERLVLHVAPVFLVPIAHRCAWRRDARQPSFLNFF